MPGQSKETKITIFCDIDGVLNDNSNMYQKLHTNYDTVASNIREENMANFKSLCDQIPHAEIVMSTSWRDFITLPEWDSLFEFYGIKHRVVGKTLHCAPNLSSDAYHMRFTDIDDYIKRNGVKFPLALDDFPLHAIPSYKTIGAYGLRKEDVFKILSMIEQKMFWSRCEKI